MTTLTRTDIVIEYLCVWLSLLNLGRHQSCITSNKMLQNMKHVCLSMFLSPIFSLAHCVRQLIGGIHNSLKL